MQNFKAYMFVLPEHRISEQLAQFRSLSSNSVHVCVKPEDTENRHLRR